MENLIGIILPPIIEVVNKDVKSDEERFLVACVVCFVAACVIHYPDITSGNATGLFQGFVLILGESITVFNLYWRNSFLRDKLQSKLNPTTQ